MVSPNPVPSLPLDLSSFVGREEELRRAGQALDRVRLLTLTGAGGSGKTRLALELLRRQPPGRPVVWVELADTSDQDSALPPRPPTPSVPSAPASPSSAPASASA